MNRPLDCVLVKTGIKSENDRHELPLFDKEGEEAQPKGAFKEVQEIGISCRGNWRCRDATFCVSGPGVDNNQSDKLSIAEQMS